MLGLRFRVEGLGFRVQGFKCPPSPVYTSSMARAGDEK